MLEKQHNQLVLGLQELYQRLRRASLWQGEPLDESSGRPLAHDILAALNILEPKSNGADDTERFEDFVEQPESSSMRDEISEAGSCTPTASPREARRDSKRQKSIDVPEAAKSDHSTPNVSSRIPSQTFSQDVPDTQHSPEQLDLQQHILPRPSLVPAMPLQDQLGASSSGLFPSYDTHASSSQDSSLDATNWNFQVPAVLPPLMTQMQGFYGEPKMDPSGSRPSLCHNWFGNGIGFDSSDFMSDFRQLSPQGPTGIDPLEPL